jgi:hypothetical protein
MVASLHVDFHFVSHTLVSIRRVDLCGHIV